MPLRGNDMFKGNGKTWEQRMYQPTIGRVQPTANDLWHQDKRRRDEEERERLAQKRASMPKVPKINPRHGMILKKQEPARSNQMVMPINRFGMRRGFGMRPAVQPQVQPQGQPDMANPAVQPLNTTQPQTPPMQGRVGGMPNPSNFRPGMGGGRRMYPGINANHHLFAGQPQGQAGLPKPDFSKLWNKKPGGMFGRGNHTWGNGGGMFGRPAFKPAVMPGMMRGRRFGAGGGMGTPPGTGGQPGMPGQPGMGAQNPGGLRRRLFARIQARRAQRAAGMQAPQTAPVAAPTEPITNG